MYLIGVLPALLTLWIRRAIPESSLWEKANEQRKAANRRERNGCEATPKDRELTSFTFFDLFASTAIRRRTIIAFLMATASAVGFWGISTWVPPYIGSVAASAGLSSPQWASFTGMVYNAGTIAGYISLGFLADAFGRRPVTLAYFAFSLLATPVLFLWTHELHLLVLVSAIVGFFGSGQLTWLSTWLPELYPTRMRATALGFIFNAPRLIAAGGTLMAGTLIVKFGGYGNAAVIVSTIYLLGLAAGPFLPETRGKPLPETV
jgi:MFS family permease